MAHDNKAYMPMSGAGITRYFEESQTKYRLKPLSVVIIIIVMILIILALHVYGGRYLG